MSAADLRVTCYSGHTYAERPVCFERQDRRYEIAEIAEAWREPGRRCFRVLTSDGGLFNLCYKETLDKWCLI